MKNRFLAICFLCLSATVGAQDKKIMAFPITDYIVEAGDSVTIVQVKLPVGLQIKENTVGILKNVYSAADTSTATIATGKCSLIKGEYCYFGFSKKNIRQKPVIGNLLYTEVMAPGIYAGSLFNVVKHSITLHSVEDKLLADISTVLKFKNAADEKMAIDQMTADIKFTATEMIKQNSNQDVMIDDGKFKGKKVFASMQAVTNADVVDFLKYINARPVMYAGNTWRFSEIIATWMVEGAPTVKE